MALLTAAKANLQRLALVRLIVIGGETAALLYAYYSLQAELRYAGLLAAIALQSAATTFTFWRLRKSWPVTDGEFFAQLLLDVGGLSLLLYCSGGATNPFVSYYLVPLAIAGAVLPSRYTVSLAATCIGAYTALLFFYDPLPLLSPLAGAHQHMGHTGAPEIINPHVVGMWFNFTLSAMLITYVVARMANALREQHDELNQRREQALHNEQLLAVATLAAGTAHELGTPLTTMKILLDEMSGDDPALRADIDMLKQQVHTCHATLKNLVATAESHQRQQFPLQAADQFVRAVLERWQIVRPTAQYRLQVESHAPTPALRPDETLQQAVLNLLNNGADACDEPLKLKLEWDIRDIVLRIRDHGAGVPLEIAEQLGKPFVTSKGKGLGLGLFLSHATIERCGGDIRLYNHPEGGTEVVLRLPIAETHYA
ncbi:MAG TPA: ATP-binding protein [Spongiibacteraceae bacterium]|nr:ATP-binding protein [Spongiibacteraceae bacterium]